MCVISGTAEESSLQLLCKYALGSESQHGGISQCEECGRLGPGCAGGSSGRMEMGKMGLLFMDAVDVLETKQQRGIAGCPVHQQHPAMEAPARATIGWGFRSCGVAGR